MSNRAFAYTLLLIGAAMPIFAALWGNGPLLVFTAFPLIAAAVLVAIFGGKADQDSDLEQRIKQRDKDAREWKKQLRKAGQ